MSETEGIATLPPVAVVQRTVKRSGRAALRNARWSALLIAASSETLIVEWALRATGWGSLGLAGFALSTVALALFNAAALMTLPRIARFGPAGYLAGRVWLVASVAALVTGPLIAAVFVLFGPLAWLGPLASERLGGVARAVLVPGGGAAVAVGFGSMFWGYLVGQRRVEVDRVDLPLPGLPDALAGLRVAQISDLHIGLQLRAPLLRELVARVNALEPDLIVITGDVFDFDPSFIAEGCAELAALDAPLGVYCVLGNHDVYTGADAVARGLESLTKIRVLRDAWTKIELQGAAFALVGIEDPGHGWSERDATHEALAKLAAELPPGLARLLLIHRPSYFAEAARLGYPVSLAGHTHGGQIALPLAHQHNVSRLISRWTRGLFRDDATGALLYVNRGLGVAGPPIRLNCAREISLHRLVRPN
ncbi:MAG TPA: metallophosphoesterase [Myxococcota bacterium]|nr:metallophosphoesterase [Myxococcota bacterium]